MLNTLVTILEFVLFFGLTIFVHELGHFIAGKLFKVKIEEFGLGYPPRMLKLFTKNGTIFSLNWIPFGGFVRFKGENDPNEAGSLAAEKPLKRLVILSSGALLNILTGILIFSLIFVQTGVPDMQKVQILNVDEQSPAESAGILSGDLITAVNGVEIKGMEDLAARINENLGREITLSYLRDGQEYTTRLTPRINPPEGRGAMGIVMTQPISQISWIQAVPYSFLASFEYSKLMLQIPGMLIRGQIAPSEARVVGPKGIYDMFSQARERDQELESSQVETPAVNTLWLLAIISIAIGFANLLPIPAMDGGRILFLLPELFFKRRIKPEYENLIHMIGFLLLIALMVYITFQDIFNPVVLPNY